jgi:hypothetical protein
MILSLSFASITFARFKRGELEQGKSTKCFLADLAKLMNTNTEMLPATCIASNPHDLPSSVLNLLKAFQKADTESDSEDWQVLRSFPLIGS